MDLETTDDDYFDAIAAEIKAKTALTNIYYPDGGGLKDEIKNNPDGEFVEVDFTGTMSFDAEFEFRSVAYLALIGWPVHPGDREPAVPENERFMSLEEFDIGDVIRNSQSHRKARRGDGKQRVSVHGPITGSEIRKAINELEELRKTAEVVEA